MATDNRRHPQRPSRENENGVISIQMQTCPKCGSHNFGSVPGTVCNRCNADISNEPSYPTPPITAAEMAKAEVEVDAGDRRLLTDVKWFPGRGGQNGNRKPVR